MDVPDERSHPHRCKPPPAGVQTPEVGSVARITLIDGFTFRSGSQRPEAVGDDLPRGVQRLVVYLCLARRPARNAVAGDLWPEVPEEQAHASLRSALWRLRKIAPGVIEGVGGALSLSSGVRVDVRELRDWADRLADPWSSAAEVTVPDLGLHGELLPGWYDDWVLLERERLRQLRLHALETLAARLADASRFGEALQAALLAVRAEPLRESAHRTLIRVHLAEGNLVEAHRAYEFFRQLLDEELGVLPSAQMNRLVPGIARPSPGASPLDDARRVPAGRCHTGASGPPQHPLPSTIAPGRPAPRSPTTRRGAAPVVRHAPRPPRATAGSPQGGR